MEVIEIKNFKDLEQGENPHQKAYISPVENAIDYEILSRNKELVYVDYLNLSEAVKVLGEFFDVNAAVIVKESLICAASLGSTLDEAYAKVIDYDPLSLSGATAGFTKSVSLNIAKQLNSMRIKNVIAPDFEKEAFKYLLETDISLIKINTGLHELQGFDAKDIRVTPFGILVQEPNLSKLSKDNFVVVSEVKPTQEQAEDAIFGWKLSKHLKSKSAIVVKDLCAKAIVQCKTNDALCTEISMDCACECSKDAVLVVDGSIDSSETINAAIQGRIALIVESGDGKNSKQILKLADKYGLSMIYTKIRNNRY